jgi:hypothetical protein
MSSGATTLSCAEASLVAVDPLIHKLRFKIRRVDAEILAAVRQQVGNSSIGYIQASDRLQTGDAWFGSKQRNWMQLPPAVAAGPLIKFPYLAELVRIEGKRGSGKCYDSHSGKHCLLAL